MPETFIHPAAVVEHGAVLGAGVFVGPFCHVGPEVVLGDRVRLASHVSIEGATTLGEDCTVGQMAVLGGPPQNAKHKGGRTTLIVGRNCTIREGVTMHRGTDTSRGETTVGDNGNFLAYAHIAHDCIVGKNVTMANGATLGGHVEIGDFVGIGGFCAVHQFCRIGHHAFLGGVSGVVGDVIPYGITVGDRAKLRGLNVIGMKRSGIERAEIHKLRNALKMVFDPALTMQTGIDAAAEAFPDSAAVRDVLDFLKARGRRHFTVPPVGRGAGGDDDDD